MALAGDDALATPRRGFPTSLASRALGTRDSKYSVLSDVLSEVLADRTEQERCASVATGITHRALREGGEKEWDPSFHYHTRV